MTRRATKERMADALRLVIEGCECIDFMPDGTPL